MRAHRRLLLLAPLALAACGGGDEPPPAKKPASRPPLRYGYLPPIRLNAAKLETSDESGASGGEDSVAPPIDLTDTLFRLARDRLKPVAKTGVARFQVQTASLTRDKDTLRGTISVRLDIREETSGDAAYAEARVTGSAPIGAAGEQDAAYDLVKSLMDDLNVELEYQIRKELRAWVVAPVADTPAQAKPAKIDRGDLPLPPPRPPAPPP